MFKMFLKILICSCFILSTRSIADTSVLVSSESVYFSRNVFVGSDRDMPIFSNYRIAIEPSFYSGKLVTPITIDSALDELRKMFPNWYLHALLKGKGDDECNVSVNNLAVSHDIDSWIWINWFEPGDSNLRKEFLRNKLTKKIYILNSLQFAFCDFLRSGNKNGSEGILLEYSILENK
ncbi:MAG: hypothetical protein COA86_02910 [Kangiella sp.]|nr:MAG: hypothetical protein COA86_02910 [Kangiella sp.]